METLLLEQDAATDHSAAVVAPVTRGMLRKRAVELAVSRGCSAQTVAKRDWEQAKHELTMGRARIRNLLPVNESALERWENEGGAC
ncbi:MAG: hypothetical protein K9N23_21755 [Akkermansiaceae bacterium]|nr:hypothetical protein [Akkermansiaceae bacterium]